MALEFLKQIFWRVKYYYNNEHTQENLLIRDSFNNNLQQFKNTYSNRRCFIIGNGPSLTPEDLDKIKGEVSFAANRIFYIYDKTEWRPTFYCAQDADVFEDISPKIDLIASESKNCFFASYCKKYLSKSPANALYYYARLIGAHKSRKFSFDISSYVDGGGTVTYAAIQLAVYMGFKTIYLLGVDHKYAANSFNDGKLNSDDVRKSYFAGMPSSIKLTKPNTNNSTISFLEAKRYADKNGIKIYNATRGGKLEVFDRVNFDEVVKNG